MENNNIRAKINNNFYYIMIGIVSLLALVFLPLFNSSQVAFGWAFPTTTAGWIVWAACKIIIIALNMIIFHSFIQQAKINSKGHPNFIEAERILGLCRPKDYKPQSPQEFLSHQYKTKGVTLFLTSSLSVFALTQALITFDFPSFLTYLFTITIAIVSGFLVMKNNEEYWQNDYLEYAKMQQQEVINAELAATAIKKKILLNETQYLGNCRNLNKE